MSVIYSWETFSSGTYSSVNISPDFSQAGMLYYSFTGTTLNRIFTMSINVMWCEMTPVHGPWLFSQGLGKKKQCVPLNSPKPNSNSMTKYIFWLFLPLLVFTSVTVWNRIPKIYVTF